MVHDSKLESLTLLKARVVGCFFAIFKSSVPDVN